MEIDNVSIYTACHAGSIEQFLGSEINAEKKNHMEFIVGCMYLLVN